MAAKPLNSCFLIRASLPDPRQFIIHPKKNFILQNYVCYVCLPPNTTPRGWFGCFGPPSIVATNVPAAWPVSGQLPCGTPSKLYHVSLVTTESPCARQHLTAGKAILIFRINKLCRSNNELRPTYLAQFMYIDTFPRLHLSSSLSFEIRNDLVRKC